MELLIQKLSTYNIVNYLLPGSVFAFLFENFYQVELVKGNVLISAFLLYFIGLVISRLGSLILEPFLIKVKFVVYSDYYDFLNAEKEDPKIAPLLEVNNMYRTILSMLLLLAGFYLFELASITFPVLDNFKVVILLLLLSFLFLFSYKKQTSYIWKRVDKVTRSEETSLKSQNKPDKS